MFRFSIYLIMYRKINNMFEYLSYILCFGILIIFLIYIYIRVKYGFWVLQPVFHVYDFGYMFNPPGIIQDSLPEKNKYTNLYRKLGNA